MSNAKPRSPLVLSCMFPTSLASGQEPHPVFVTIPSGPRELSGCRLSQERGRVRRANRRVSGLADFATLVIMFEKHWKDSGVFVVGLPSLEEEESFYNAVKNIPDDEKVPVIGEPFARWLVDALSEALDEGHEYFVLRLNADQP